VYLCYSFGKSTIHVNSNFVKSAKIGLCYQFVHGGVLKHSSSQKLSKKIQRKLDSSESHGCR